MVPDCGSVHQGSPDGCSHADSRYADVQAAIPGPMLSPRLTPGACRAFASLLVVVAAFLLAAWLGGSPPFAPRGIAPYSEAGVLRAIPFDTPLPYDRELVAAGRGERLPYHAEWTSSLAPHDASAQIREHLAGSLKWQHTQAKPIAGEFESTFARVGSDGYMTHWALLSVRAVASQTVITLDLTPIPTGLAPDP
jgi:hypothetical protein